MIVKNAAGEKHDIVFHHFFPTNRKRIAKLLDFISDNLDKRDKYYGIMMKYLTSRYIAADYEIEILKAERQAKNRALHEAHVQQANLRKRAKWMSASTFRDKNRALHEAHVQQANLRKRAKWMSASTFRDKNRALHEAHVQQANLRKRAKWMSASTFRDKNRALEETIMPIERRKMEITLELSAAKHLKDRLKINTQLMVEVKPW